MTLYMRPADLAGKNNDSDLDDRADHWQPLRRPLQRLADRLRLQRATMITIAEAAGINVDGEAD